MKDSKDPFVVNDFNSDLSSKKEKKLSLNKKIIIISGVSILFSILVIIIIILVIKLSHSKSEKENKKVIREINCIYDINEKEKNFNSRK